MHPHVLDRNIRDFAIQLYLLLHEAALGLDPFAMRELQPVATECDEVKQRLLSRFGLSEP